MAHPIGVEGGDGPAASPDAWGGGVPPEVQFEPGTAALDPLRSPAGAALLAGAADPVGRAPILLAQAGGGAQPPDPEALAEAGDVAGAAAFMEADPERIDEVLAAFSERRPGLIPDLVEASAGVLEAKIAEEGGGEGEATVGNRVWGALRMIGGGIEAAAGAAVVAAPDPFVVTDILGVAAVAHGGDNAVAGARQLWTGRSTESVTERAAEAIAEGLGAGPDAAELIGDGVDIALGLGLGSASAIRALGRVAQRSASVWDDITVLAANGPLNYPGTVVPRVFNLRAGDAVVHVAANGSKHIADDTAHIAERLAARGLDDAQELVDLSAQLQLDSLRAAVREAARGGLAMDEMIEVAGWQLKFSAAREAGQLPVLKHAIPLKYVD